MNAKTLSVILSAVGCVLLLLTAVLASRLKISSPAPRPSETRVVGLKSVPVTEHAAVARSRKADWASLYSTNYQQWIANLRAFGCPEQTVQDIVIMDIAKLYARKRAEVRRHGKPYEYWRAEDHGDHELDLQLAALRREQHQLVRDLLDVELASARARYWEEEDPAVDYDFLSPQKRQRLADLFAKYEAKEEAIYTRTQGHLQPADEEELRALDQQRASELRTLLTPEEREQYELRYSMIAQTIRSQLTGIHPTEEEFKRLFAVYKKFERDMTEGLAVSQSTGGQFRTPERLANERAFQEEVRAALGEERFAELQRSHDPAYETLVQVVQRFDLPREMPAELYDLKTQAEQQKFEVDANPRLTSEQRRAALSAIARETERALASALGPDVYRTYARTGGDWITSLRQPEVQNVFAP